MAASETVNIVLAAKDLASSVFGDVSKQATGLKDATKSLGATFQNLAIMAAPAAAVVTAAGVAMAATFKLAASAADAGDALNDMAKRTGISVEALSQYRLAAEQSGTSMDGLAIGMRGLSQNMLEAKNPTSQAAQAFSTLGVSAFDTAGKARPLDEMIGVLSDKFQQMPDGPEKAALAMQVFGKAGTELIPLLNEGSAGIARMRKEAADLGQTWTSDAAGGADAFNDQLARVKAGMGGVTEEIGKKLMPAVSEWMYGVELIAKDTIKWLKGTEDQAKTTTATVKREEKAMAEHHAVISAEMLANAKKLAKQEMDFREAQAKKERLLYEQLAEEKKNIERGNEEFSLAMTRLRLQHEDEESARRRTIERRESDERQFLFDEAIRASEAYGREERDRVVEGISLSDAWRDAYGDAFSGVRTESAQTERVMEFHLREMADAAESIVPDFRDAATQANNYWREVGFTLVHVVEDSNAAVSQVRQNVSTIRSLESSNGALQELLTPAPRNPSPTPSNEPYIIRAPTGNSGNIGGLYGGVPTNGFQYAMQGAPLVTVVQIDGKEIARAVHKQSERGNPVTTPPRRKRWG